MPPGLTMTFGNGVSVACVSHVFSRTVSSERSVRRVMSTPAPDLSLISTTIPNAPYQDIRLIQLDSIRPRAHNFRAVSLSEQCVSVWRHQGACGLSGIQIHGVRVTDVAEETLRNVLAIVRDAAPLEPVLSPNGYRWGRNFR